MSSPLVCVIGYGLAAGRVSGWDTAAVAVPASYLEALRRAGARPLLIGAPDPGSPDEILEPFDGLVLIGGGDVDPGRYGQARHPDDYGIDAERDSLEVDLLLEADRTEVPVLAICRGMQVVNVAFGGTLHQHIPDVPSLHLHRAPGDGVVLHSVKVAESSRLHQASGHVAMEVASAHHQAVDGLGEGLVPVAWAGDGLIEAIERPDGWVVAVQWHPEETAATDQSQQAIFDGFAAQARRRSGA
jgi:putative glutamine amidotransferase